MTRLQLDLETTGLDPDIDRIFMVAVRGPAGEHQLLEATGDDDDAEAALLRRLAALPTAFAPGLIETTLHVRLRVLDAAAERLTEASVLGARRDLTCSPSGRARRGWASRAPCSNVAARVATLPAAR